MMTIKFLLVAILGISMANAAMDSCGYDSVGFFGSDNILVPSNGHAMLFNVAFNCSDSIGSIDYEFDVAMESTNKQYWAIWRPQQNGNYKMISERAFTQTTENVKHTDTINPAVQVQSGDIIGIHMDNSFSPAPLPYVDDTTIGSCTGSCSYSSSNLVHYATWNVKRTGPGSIGVGSTWDVSGSGNPFSTGPAKRFPTIEVFS